MRFDLNTKKDRDRLSERIDMFEKNLPKLRRNLAVFYVSDARNPNFKLSKDDYLKTIQNLQITKIILHDILSFLNQAIDRVTLNWQWTDEDDKNEQK